MPARFSKVAPDPDDLDLSNWEAVIQDAANKLTYYDYGTDISLSEGYSVEYVSLGDIVDERLSQDPTILTNVWRYIVFLESQAISELECHESEIVTAHFGPSKDGLLEAIQEAERSNHDEFDFSVVSVPALSFVALKIRTAAQEPTFIPFVSSQSSLPSYQSFSEGQVLSFLKPVAEQMIRDYSQPDAFNKGG